MNILIGTRGSQLALAQAEGVRAQISRLSGVTGAKLEVVKTLGDHLSVSGVPDPLAEPPQGIFTRELDEALLSGKIRAAIHSLKDVPTVLPVGIRYGAFLKREDPRDALISLTGHKFFELPAGSKIGTSSPRRESQIRAIRSDLNVVPLRGNVDTRLKKMRQGDMDAIVVAAAGIRRLGLEGEITEILDKDVLLPAPAQGALCLTIREGDEELLTLLKFLNHFETQVCVEAERAFLRTLQGGCRIPVGALAHLDGETLFLSGVIAQPNGEQIMRNHGTGHVDHPKELGDNLAKSFLRNGAQEILNGFGRSSW
ncbi:MAG TPA: hydroxymethylbilane synthase [bacterium]